MTVWYDNYIPEPNSGCWIWMGAISGRGYGTCLPAGQIGGQHYAHRLFYEMYRGQIPDGAYACHHCDNKCCCNPDHIFIGTQSDNLNDHYRKGRGRPNHGENRYNAKLNNEKVAIIRASTKKQRELAAEFGVDRSLISAIKHGKWWRRAP